MASPSACSPDTSVNAMQYQNLPSSDAGQLLHTYGQSGDASSAPYLSPLVLTGHPTSAFYGAVAAVPVGYSSVDPAARTLCPVMPMCPTTTTSQPTATAACGGMGTSHTQPFMTTVPAPGAHYGASAMPAGPLVVPVQCVDPTYGLSSYDTVNPSNPVYMAAPPAGEPYTEASQSRWTVEQLVNQLEALLNRDALSERRDVIIDCLVRSSPSFKVSAEALASHPLLLPATVSEILEAASMSSILDAELDTRMVVPELRAKRLTLIFRDVAPDVTAYHITSLLCQNSAVVPAEEKEAVLGLATPQQPVDATATPSSTGATCGTPSSVSAPTGISFRGVSSFLRSLRYMGASSWFLALNDERLVEDVAWWLRGQMLQGAPVQVRIKTESSLRRRPLEFPAPRSSFLSETHIPPQPVELTTAAQGDTGGAAPAVAERTANGRPSYRRRGGMGRQRLGGRYEKATDPGFQNPRESSDPKKPVRNLTAIIATPEGVAPRYRTRFVQKKNAALDATQTESERPSSSSLNDQHRSSGTTSGAGRFASRNHIKPLGATASSTSKITQGARAPHPSSEADHTRRPAQGAKTGNSYARRGGLETQRNGYTKRQPSSQQHGRTTQLGGQPRIEEAHKVVTSHGESAAPETGSTILIGAHDFPPLSGEGSVYASPTLNESNGVTSVTTGEEQSLSSAKEVDDDGSPTYQPTDKAASVSLCPGSAESATRMSGNSSEDLSSSLEKEQEATSGSETDQRKESTSVTTTTGSVTSTRNETTEIPTATVSHDAASRMFWASCQKKLQIIVEQHETDDRSKGVVQPSLLEASEKATVLTQGAANLPVGAVAGSSHNGKPVRQQQQHSTRSSGQNVSTRQQPRFRTANDGRAPSNRPDSHTAKNRSNTASGEGQGRRQNLGYAGPRQAKTGPTKFPQQQEGLAVQQPGRSFQQAKEESGRPVRNP